jgi:hypothetical protein
MQLEAIAPKSKPATDDLLTGQAIELCNDTCRCGSLVVIVDNDRQLNCRSCGRKRGYLSKPTADWLVKVIVTFGGAKDIAVRLPPDPPRSRRKFTNEEYELCQVDSNPKAIVRAAKAKLQDELPFQKLGAKKYSRVRFVKNPNKPLSFRAPARKAVGTDPDNNPRPKEGQYYERRN